MKQSPLTNMSDEQRAEVIKMAQEARIAKRAAGQHLRQDFGDETLWRSLASEVGLRMASSYIPCTEIKYVNKALKVVGKDTAWLKNHSGLSTKEFMLSFGDDAPAWAIQGLILEMANTPED